MTFVGDMSLWSDVFPEDLIPGIFDVIIEAWGKFAPPSPTEHEVPITQRFRHVVKQTKTLRRLPVRIEREPAEDDPDTGEELGRIDLKFNPAGSAAEEVYFAFECKRVNSKKGNRWRSNAPEYINDGMMRFVSGQYAAKMQHGGMIGYILNGSADKSIKLIEKNIIKQSMTLKMTVPAQVIRSLLRPDVDLMRETSHNLMDTRSFRIHHIFLSCPSVQSTKDSTAEPAVQPDA